MHLAKFLLFCDGEHIQSSGICAAWQGCTRCVRAADDALLVLDMADESIAARHHRVLWCKPSMIPL